MTKLNISMPQELLEVIDSEAATLGLSRSGLIQEASARYVATARSDREAELRRLRTQKASERMQHIGRELGLDGAEAVELLRASRDAEGSRRG